MKQKKVSMDGFVTRRPQRAVLNERTWDTADTSIGHMRTDQRDNAKLHTGNAHQERQMNGHGGDLKQSIGESLREIDIDANASKEKKQKKRKRRKIAKIISLVVGLIAVLVVGFLLYKAWQVGSQVFKGDMLGIFQQQELKMDQHGRSNMLILGSTDDMPGREGASLTDSMMVLSVDQKKKDAYMFSIPRDLWVKYDMPCVAGYEGKINAVYSCASNGGSDTDSQAAGMDATREFVGDLFDIDIQYVVHVNTVVIRDSVNAIGGITVNVESSDERGVLDATFDDMCNDEPSLCPSGHYMDFPNGPNKMNGNQAMAFSQARGLTIPSYGFADNNFDRERHQQLVLMALKDKATSSGTLTDVTKVLGLMDAMGDNLRTNIDSKEVQTIMSLASGLDNNKIHRLDFYKEDNRLLTTGPVSGTSAVYPAEGVYDYSEVRSFIKKNIYATGITKEAAKVAVLNGGAVAGAAQEEADKLEELGMDVVLVDNAPEGSYGQYSIFSMLNGGSKNETAKKLQELYGTNLSSSKPLFELSEEVDFIVILGSAIDSIQ